MQMLNFVARTRTKLFDQIPYQRTGPGQIGRTGEQPDRRIATVLADHASIIGRFDDTLADETDIGAAWLQADQVDAVIVMIVKLQLLASALHGDIPFQHGLSGTRLWYHAQLLQGIRHFGVVMVIRDVRDTQSQNL